MNTLMKAHSFQAFQFMLCFNPAAAWQLRTDIINIVGYKDYGEQEIEFVWKVLKIETYYDKSRNIEMCY